MDIRKLQRAIVDGLEDVKAHNIVVFNTEHLSPLFERVIIASGTSNRQTKALAASVRDAVKGAGLPPPRVEGEENGEWIIVDCGPAVVHVMQPTFRDYYHLEELWGEKPVKMKLQGAPVGLPKAAAPAASARALRAVPEDASPARKAAVRGPSSRSTSGTASPGAKRASTRATGSDDATPAARRTTAKRTAATPRSGAPSRAGASRATAVPRKSASPGVTRTVGVKSSAAKKAAAPAGSTRRKTPPKG